MIVLPDDEEMPVAAQVNGLIGDALRQSVADAELSPGFSARLAAALDSAGLPGPPVAVAQPGSLAVGEGAPRAAGQGSEAAEAAS